MINVIFMTCLYGPGMPMLFPLALLCLVSLYVTERLCMAYSYVKPAMYDHRINRDAIHILQFGPLLYCIMGVVIYSSSRVFLEQYSDYSEMVSY